MTSKKKTTGLGELLFDEVNPFGAVVGEVVSRPVERFPLADIRPDPDQPRRLLPSDLAAAVNSGELEPAAAVAAWLRRAEADPDSVTAREVRELQRLASAIAQHGLINPITIRPDESAPGRYWIVTGERRYWAHVLLAAEGRPVTEGETAEPADQIKAALVPPGVSIRAHQIVENLMREDINVVEKAHGLVALRDELSQAAAATGEPPREVPWKLVEDALDMSRQYRLRIVSVLELSEAAQQLVDRHNLAEATIRPVIARLKPYPDLQLRALNQVIAWQAAEERGEGEGRQIVPSVRALVDKLLLGLQPPARRMPVEGLDFDRLRRQVRGALRVIESMDARARQDLARAAESRGGAAIVDDLRSLRAELDRVLAALAEAEAGEASDVEDMREF